MQDKEKGTHRHHGGVRGADSHINRSSSRGVSAVSSAPCHLRPASFSQDALNALWAAMTSPHAGDRSDAEENQWISAGYTYLGQFIAHDLTFDPESSLVKQNDMKGLTSARHGSISTTYMVAGETINPTSMQQMRSTCNLVGCLLEVQ
jgi:hypothetical protein